MGTINYKCDKCGLEFAITQESLESYLNARSAPRNSMSGMFMKCPECGGMATRVL